MIGLKLILLKECEMLKPEQSYITMEIHDGQIVQARTKNNGPLDKLGEQFVEAFRAEKLEKKKIRQKVRIAV